MPLFLRDRAMAGLLLGLVAASAEGQEPDIEEIRRQLVDARTRVLRSSGTMTLTTESEGLLMSSVTPKGKWTKSTRTWAFWGPKTYSAAEISETLFDGNRTLFRSRNGDRYDVRISDVATVDQNPLEFGYKIARFEGSVTPLKNLWLCDLLRFKLPAYRRLPDGRIELRFDSKTNSEEGEFRIVVSPKHGWLMEETLSKKITRTGSNFVQITEDVRNVTEVVRVGEVWIPKKYYFGTRGPNGEISKSRVVTASSIRKDVDETRFTNFFKPGDYVRDGSERFIVQDDGSFLPAPRGSGRGGNYITEYVKIVACLAGLSVLAFAVLKWRAGTKLKRAR